MSAEYATFGLAPAMRAGGVLANGDYQVHRDFLDFIVDGRPLLFQLSDLDAVSPLASDVPPAIFTAQVRSLLLEADAPLADGRYVIYGCPECADLACGAVTAVIERDGDDYVWRDFAWQTDEHADLELNGYTASGRSVSAAPSTGTRSAPCCAEAAAEPLGRPPGPADRRPRRRPRQTRRRAAHHRHRRGHHAGRRPAYPPTNCAATAPSPSAGRSARRNVPPYALAFDRAGVEVAYVDGLAPIIPLLVAQIEHALDRSPSERRRLTRLVAAGRRGGRRGDLHLSRPAGRVPPGPPVPHPHSRSSTASSTRPAPHRAGREGREGGVVHRGAYVGSRAGGARWPGEATAPDARAALVRGWAGLVAQFPAPLPGRAEPRARGPGSEPRPPGAGSGPRGRRTGRPAPGVRIPSMTATLVAKDLAAGHGDRSLFSGLDLVVAPGDVIGLVGANGAGKSTLLRLLAGLLTARARASCGSPRPPPPSAICRRSRSAATGETVRDFLARRTGVAAAQRRDGRGDPGAGRRRPGRGRRVRRQPGALARPRRRRPRRAGRGGRRLARPRPSASTSR